MKNTIEADLFFNPPSQQSCKKLNVSHAWEDTGVLFGWYKVALDGKPPAWFENPFSGATLFPPHPPWWKLSDFNLDVGDIKTIWEASRFDWVIALAIRAKAGENSAVERLNTWLADWCNSNPTYYGPHWKCGQEASIRVMHLLFAAKLLGQKKGTPAFLHLVEAHLQRIGATLSYALAQDNNHTTSEAAALYMGGLWCKEQGGVKGEKWARKGRRLLERGVKRLVDIDGSFSQYSLNYHRVLLDTLAMVEIWRRDRGDYAFSKLFYDRARLATDWLFNMVDPQTGDGPNIGGNDGARLLPITDTDYRDYRPSVQLAMALFRGRRAYEEDGAYNLPLVWNNISIPIKLVEKRRSRLYDRGGYAVLKNDSFFVVLKYPRYKFRPRHCDALHLDLWLGKRNIFRDGGSYRYNATPKWNNYFTGVISHNTVQFDNRDQMPHLSRFLKGAWLYSQDLVFRSQMGNSSFCSVSYEDWKGAKHKRLIELFASKLVVNDHIQGFSDKAVLRWRLEPGNWEVEENIVYGKNCCLEFESDVPIVRFEIVQGWESRYYYKKTLLPVIEIEVREFGQIQTTVTITH